MIRSSDYYTDVMRRRRYYDDPYYRYYKYYQPYQPYRNYIYDSQLSNLNQNITNFGYMQDVYQNALINQLMLERRHYL